MNVLVYAVDALRADALSCYGYDRETTPNLDGIAAEGVRYGHCFSPSTWTRPVAATLLTGLSPPAHGVRTREDLFRVEVPSLAATLTDRGYETVGVSAMGNVSSAVGFDRGFSEFFDLYRDPDVVRRRETRDPDAEEFDHDDADEVALPRSEDVVDRLLAWIDGRPNDGRGDDARPAGSDGGEAGGDARPGDARGGDGSGRADRPFFAFCWAIDPHVPYDPPEGFREYVDPGYDGPVDGSRARLPEATGGADLAHLRALYDGEVRYADAQVGRLLEGLAERDLAGETLLVVLGDHGDAFREHGRLTHGHLPYDELARVPLVVRPPSGTTTAGSGADDTVGSGGEVIDEVVSLVDVVPTLLAACGVDPGEVGHPLQGRPLPPFGPAGSSAPVRSETHLRPSYPAFYGVRTADWKYMVVESPDRGPGTYLALARNLLDRSMVTDLLRHPLYYLRRYRHDEDEYLFDLAADPDETENLVERRPEQAARLADELAEWLAEGERIHASLAASSGGDGTGGPDRETERQLRRLGYVD